MMARSSARSFRNVLLLASCCSWISAQELLQEIQVVGNAKQTSETVIFKSGLKVGQELSSVDFSAVIERLWATGTFDDIKVELSESEGKKILIIRVKERPLIKEVDYRGGTEIGVTNIKDKIKEKKLTPATDVVYDPEVARKVKNQIVDMAAEKGFRTPVVDVILESMSTSTARLVFDIKEGGKVKIYKVKFKGNKVISSSILARAMKKTREHWMFSWLTSHDLLVSKNLEEDLENIKKAYWRMGYKDVFVGKPTIEVEDHTPHKQKVKNAKLISQGRSPKYDLRATLVVPVMEGDQFFEGSFKVTGNEKVLKEHFYQQRYAEMKRDNRSVLGKFLGVGAKLEEDPRRPFDLDALNQTVDKLKEDHSNASFITWNAEKILDVRDDKGVKRVDVTLKVNEGESFKVRRIEFEGNTTTKDKVLRRSMMLREGDPFRVERFKDSLLGMSQLGFFDVKNAEPKVEPVGDKPEVDITVRGEEAGVNEILVQGGYSQLFGFSLGGSFSTRNLGGGGETLGLNVNTGKFQKSAYITFTEPYIFDRPYSFAVSLGNTTTQYDASRVGVENAYSQRTRSLGLNVGTRLNSFLPEDIPDSLKTFAFFTNVGLGYSYRLISIEGGWNYFYRDVKNQLTSALSASIGYSTVDHPFKPTTGGRISYSMEYGGWQFGSDRPYLRNTWEAAKFGSIGERNIFAINTSYGYYQNLSKESVAPWEMYRPGGEQSIRGYRWGNVGSVYYDYLGRPVVVGGNKQFIINGEYQFKIADQFRFVLFYDAGNAWAPGVKIFHESLRRSAGIEFRFFLPISPAPLRLIWSRKLNPYPFDPDGKSDFQFSIGSTF